MKWPLCTGPRLSSAAACAICRGALEHLTPAREVHPLRLRPAAVRPVGARLTVSLFPLSMPCTQWQDVCAAGPGVPGGGELFDSVGKLGGKVFRFGAIL